MSDTFKEEMKGTELAIRTRKLPDLVKKQLVSEGIEEKQAEIVAKKISQFGKSEKKNKKGKESKEKLDMDGDGSRTAQIMFLTHKDVEAVASVMKEAIQKGTLSSDSPDDLQKKAIDRGLRPITPDIALFGRMITSDMFRDVEASMQVAHAISTNKMEHEFDYFTAVDDLQDGTTEEGPGAGMIGDVEFNSACYYKYFSLDFDGLVENLAGPRPADNAPPEEKDRYQRSLEVAREVARHTLKAFIRAAVYTTPTGKQNTFAAHQPPSAILIEVRQKNTPISYANAFVEPSRPNGRADLIKDSTQKLTSYAETLTKKFNLASTKRLWLSTVDDAKINGTETCDTIDDMIASLEKTL